MLVIKIKDAIHYPSRIPATQWQHTLTQRQRLGHQDESRNPRHAVAAYPNPTATPWTAG